jgi:hypothetical protein
MLELVPHSHEWSYFLGRGDGRFGRWEEVVYVDAGMTNINTSTSADGSTPSRTLNEAKDRSLLQEERPHSEQKTEFITVSAVETTNL